MGYGSIGSMHSHLIVPGIRFNDCYFTEPVSLADWVTPKFPGLFVILSADPNWAPKSFQPLCFGEFGNNAPHPLKQREYAGLASAPGRRHLFVALLPMPFSTGAQRNALRNELVSAYHPILQGSLPSAPEGLVHRIDDLEKRHREDTAQVLLLLGNLNKQFEPQPVPHRRRIGFLPESKSPASESRTYY